MDRTRDARGVSFERRLAPVASLGPPGDLLVGAPPHPAQIRPVDPILPEDDIRLLTGWRREGWAARTRNVLFPIDEGVVASGHALDVLSARNIPRSDSLP